MKTTVDLLHAVGTAAWPSLWLPVLLWTALCGPAVVLLRHCARVHPVISYHTHQALLLALPLGLLVAATTDLALPAAALPSTAAALALLLPEVQAASPYAAPVATLPYVVIGLLTVAAGILAAWHLGRVGRDAFLLHRLRAHGRAGSVVQDVADRLAAQLGIRRPVRIMLAGADVLPLTYGWRRPVVVLPASLAGDRTELTLALTHELVHVRRHDYVLHCIEQLMAACFRIHPLVGYLSRTVDRYREMACDAEVLATRRFNPRQYAALLFRFSQPQAGPSTVALGMGKTSDLTTRIRAMQTYPRTDMLKPKRIGLALGIFVLAGSSLFVACSDVVDSGDAARTTADATSSALEAVDQMPALLPSTQEGLQALAATITYPEIAKSAGIEGQVLVEFVVDEQGRVVSPTVKKGIGSGCDEEALRAVQTLSFAPGQNDGKPVRVKMTLPITFRLSDDAKASDATASS